LISSLYYACNSFHIDNAISFNDVVNGVKEALKDGAKLISFGINDNILSTLEIIFDPVPNMLFANSRASLIPS
jgi:hypothetical protein